MLKIEIPKHKEKTSSEVSSAPERDEIRSIEGQMEEEKIDKVTFTVFEKTENLFFSISDINVFVIIDVLFYLDN